MVASLAATGLSGGLQQIYFRALSKFLACLSTVFSEMMDPLYGSRETIAKDDIWMHLYAKKDAQRKHWSRAIFLGTHGTC